MLDELLLTLCNKEDFIPVSISTWDKSWAQIWVPSGFVLGGPTWVSPSIGFSSKPE